ncbi:ankyrin repeat domain-containing protein 17-like [Cocos nucifera]|uniref:Ankyrin repeat domain-containing protein 17-like n=1 Tax=Cocos nucifera TaxID=13894 RepID=A0A8K0II34_COCNU|nr:ankyrin repeat domain-containing protein 17-like [Cocos nucifera]
MLAAASVRPVVLLPTLSLGGCRPRCVVAAKLPNRRNPAKTTSEEAAGVATVAATKSGAPRDGRALGSNPRTGRASEAEGGSRGPSSLRGSDVLQALQRAVAAKEARKGRKRRPTRSEEGDGGGGVGGGEGDGDLPGDYDYGEAQPIEEILEMEHKTARP